MSNPVTSPHCPVCDNVSPLFDVVDFNKSCDELQGKFLALSGIPVYYNLCNVCGFAFAPQICSWSLADFEQRIYNDQYREVDPDYVEARPRNQAINLTKLFGAHAGSIRHLDYGGGDGLLSTLLRDAGFDSSSYDPFVQRTAKIGDLGTFDLISAIEVFEHVPDVTALMTNLRALLKPDGIVFFTTLTSDGSIVKNKRLTWWYAAPRNGHISLFSKKSLTMLAGKHGFSMGSFNEGAHMLWRTVPGWASHLIRAHPA
jgi:SAM-dependent methyltransferase